MFKLARQLKKMGVLGLNQRNTQYTLRCNPRRFYPLVDDKLRTKELALKAGISVPELYGVIEAEHQRRSLHPLLDRYNNFAIKPSRGFIL